MTRSGKFATRRPRPAPRGRATAAARAVDEEAKRAEDKPAVSAEERAASLWGHLRNAFHLVEREAGRERSLGQAALLTQLGDSSTGVTTAELASATLLPARNVSSMVRRLQEEGLIARRAPRGRDGTAKLKLTNRGAQLAEDLRVRQAGDLAEIFRALPDQDLDDLDRLLGRAATRLEKRFSRSIAPRLRPGGRR